MFTDLRYALRSLLKSPGFTLIAVITLALGIGANASIFSAVRAVVLRPLPYHQPDQLAQLFIIWQGSEAESHSPPNFVDLRAQNTTFSDMAAYFEQGHALTGEGNAEQIEGANVSGGFFGVAGVNPMLGRMMLPADVENGAPLTVVLGAALWQRRFGGDPAIVGKRVMIDGNSHEVIGVMPASFNLPLDAELWLPMQWTADELATQRGAYYIDVIGRLKDGVTLEQARADVATIATRLAQQHPNSNANVGETVHTLHEAITGDVRAPMLLLLGAVGLVLLIACVNVANLLLVRGVSRTRELAVRAALGANSGRLIRAQLVESLVLATVGGAAGLVVAMWGGGLIQQATAADVPFLNQTQVDGSVVAFTAVVTLVTGLLFGLFPAWQASRTLQLGTRLREESGSSIGDRGRHRVRHGLVVAQLALATTLLVGAGLLLRSLLEMSKVELGLEPAGVMSFHVDLPDSRYPTPESRDQFTRSVIERLRALPGVQDAAASFSLPLAGFNYFISGHQRDGRELDSDEQTRTTVAVRAVTPAFFETMGIALRSGRTIADTDSRGAPEVIVVNEAAAKLIWPDVPNVIGRTFTVGSRLSQGGERAGGEVVGVVADVREDGPAKDADATIYLAHAQRPVSYLGIVMKTSGDPLVLTEPARRAMAELDPDLPLFQVGSMEQLASEVVAQPRLYAALLATFAGVALLLASIGVYGVIAYGVRSRTREIGVRVALGATSGLMLRSVVGQGFVLAATGIAIGLGIAAAAGRVMRGLLFGVQPADLTTYVFVAGCLLFVAVLASWLPARRAARVDPMVALRSDG